MRLFWQVTGRCGEVKAADGGGENDRDVGGGAQGRCAEKARANRALGQKGEKLARKYLKKQGYRHLRSNYATNRGEIDLIMQDGRTVVFVEVKTRQREDFVPGEAVVNYHKRKHISAVAKQFIQVHKLYDYPCRFDVVVVIFKTAKDKPEIRHQTNAFSLC